MFRVVVHLVNGTSVAGKSEEIETKDMEAFKEVMSDMLSGSGSWQVNVEAENGGWAIVPKDSVLWIEVERTA